MNPKSNAEEEGGRLKKKFQSLKAETGMGKAEFARTFKVPGGASMISQNISGHRPISLEAAVAYMTGFKCSIADISPSLAAQLPNGDKPNNSTEAGGVSVVRIGTPTARQALEGLATLINGADSVARAQIKPLLALMFDEPQSIPNIIDSIEAALQAANDRQTAKAPPKSTSSGGG